MSDEDFSKGANRKVPGKNAYRYRGHGGVNNNGAYKYADTERQALMVDFIEVLAVGYTVDRAVRRLAHWATAENSHFDVHGKEIDGPHPTWGRAVPSRKTFYMWKEEDPGFSDAWDEAYNIQGTEHLEDHAMDMAYAGDSKMVQFLLRARHPGKYANFGAVSGGSFQITISKSDEDL